MAEEDCPEHPGQHYENTLYSRLARQLSARISVLTMCMRVSATSLTVSSPQVTIRGKLVLNPAIVAHALGIALLDHFRRATSPSFETLQAELTEWLDPIAGFDERADILRAAVSILVAQERAAEPPIPGVLVTAWLQSQDLSEEHLQELAALAPSFPNALLDAVEHSARYYHDAARRRAVDALREIPRTDSTALTEIVTRAKRWLRKVPSRCRGPRGTYGPRR